MESNARGTRGSIAEPDKTGHLSSPTQTGKDLVQNDDTFANGLVLGMFKSPHSQIPFQKT